MLMADTSTSGGHDIREVWTTPMSNPDSDWVILYSAEYISGSDPDGRAFGCASVTKDCTINPPSDDSTDTDKSRVGDEIKNEDPLILPETGFRPNMITDLQAQPSWKAYAQHNSLMLEIESLGIQVQIVGVPYIGRTWDVTWLGSRAGYLHGTAFPTWPGNTVITAHVYGADGLPGPFVELHSLSYDDEIFITAWGQKYLYQVRENFLAYPDDKMIFNHNTYDWLTLLTCEGYDERNNFYNYRRIIQAVLTQIIS
jgi:sortase (surface protein transpeptidase)